MRSELDGLWAKLIGTPPNPAGGWSRLRVPGLGQTPAYLAVSLVTGLEGLILEIPTASLPSGGGLPASHGFDLASEPVTPGRTGTTRLILALKSEGFRDVYRALAVDVAQTLATSAADTAAASFISRVRRWQRFLEVHGADGLSDSARRGLFAELLVLRELLDAGSNAEEVLDGWRGPLREPHDFVLPGGDIEVKSTSRQATERVEIANLEQLDGLGAPQLYMVHTLLVETEEVGPTLSELVGDVADLAGNGIDLLRERLHLAGYLDEHASRYSFPRYQVLTSDWFLVDGRFPRLTAESIPDGVLSARYSISLSAMEPHRLADFDPVSLTSA